MNREYIGLNDKDGNPIHVGDVVEFYFDEHYGACAEPIFGLGLTRMRDIVVKIDGEYYFQCHYGSACAWRFADYCTIIGQDTSLVDT